MNLKNALQIDHNDVNALSSYGDVLFSMKKYEEAIKKYEKALKFSEIAEVHFNLGHCYYLIEQFDYAVSHYINALKIKKNTRHTIYEEENGWGHILNSGWISLNYARKV